MTEYAEERRFVLSYIRKERQERLLYELAHPRKKNGKIEGLERFCHESDKLLDPTRIMLHGDKMLQSSEFERFFERCEDQCLILSPDASLHGQRFPLGIAIERSVFCSDAVIVLGTDFAVVFGEAMKSGRDQFLVSESPFREA